MTDLREAPEALDTALTRFLAAAERRGLTEIIDDSSLARALYASDASLYRVVPPQAIATPPRTTDELVALLDLARDAGLPLTARGSGTSCAGNAVGPGLVVDLRRHLHEIIEIDPAAMTARVQPGVVQQTLNRETLAHGMKFGPPDPSTSTRCTIGGMIGNNACGPRGLGYGRTADNVIALEVVLGTGERLTVGSGQDTDSPALTALQRLVQENLATIRTSSACSDGRCPAIRWSICCRRTVSMSPSSWSGPRAPWPPSCRRR